MQEPLFLVAERLPDSAVLIIAILAVSLLVLETVFLVVVTFYFVATRQTASRQR